MEGREALRSGRTRDSYRECLVWLTGCPKHLLELITASKRIIVTEHHLTVLV